MSLRTSVTVEAPGEGVHAQYAEAFAVQQLFRACIAALERLGDAAACVKSLRIGFSCQLGEPEHIHACFVIRVPGNSEELERSFSVSTRDVHQPSGFWHDPFFLDEGVIAERIARGIRAETERYARTRVVVVRRLQEVFSGAEVM